MRDGSIEVRAPPVGSLRRGLSRRAPRAAAPAAAPRAADRGRRGAGHARDRARGAPARRQAPDRRPPADPRRWPPALILALGVQVAQRGRRPARVPVGAAGLRAAAALPGAARRSPTCSAPTSASSRPARSCGPRCCSRGAALYPAVAPQLRDLRADRARSRSGFAVLALANWVFGANSADDVPLAAAAARDRLRARLARRCAAAAPRHAEQMVNAAGLAIARDRPDRGGAGALVVAVRRSGSRAAGLLPSGWELVVLAAGCGLVAYGAVDRAPGAGLARRREPRVLRRSRRASSDEDTLLCWPLLLLAARRRRDGRRPAPARAAAARAERATRPASVPLASRTDEDEVTVPRARRRSAAR